MRVPLRLADKWNLMADKWNLMLGRKVEIRGEWGDIYIQELFIFNSHPRLVKSLRDVKIKSLYWEGGRPPPALSWLCHYGHGDDIPPINRTCRGRNTLMYYDFSSLWGLFYRFTGLDLCYVDSPVLTVTMLLPHNR